MLSIIKSEFTFFQVQIEGTFGNTFKLSQSGLCQAPKVFNSIDMTVSIRKLVLSMLNPIMLAIAKIHQSIVGFKAIGINRCIFADMFLNDWVKFLNLAFFDYLCINFPLSFYQTKDNLFAFRSSPSDPTYSPCSKVAFIHLNAAFDEDALLFANDSNTHSKGLQKPIDGISAETRQFGYFDCFYVAGKKTDHLSCFGFGNVRTIYILVNHMTHNTLSCKNYKFKVS